MTPDERPSAGNPVPGLQPPGAHLQPGESGAGRHGLTWLALALVIVLGLGALLVLPKLVSGVPDTDLHEIPAPVAAASPSSTVPDAAAARGKAQQSLQDFLRTRARLELANAAVWGEPEWGRALDGANRGNDLFTQRQFSMANEAFSRSTEILLLIESERGLRLAAALDSGWQALENDDSAAATEYFDMALAIDPGSQDALDGLEQARVRPDMLRLMADGDFALATGDLPAAQVIYLEAVRLDRAYEPAQAALRDVTDAIDKQAFRTAMSRAIGALEAGQVETAEAALAQAASIEPDAEVVRNTRQELETLRRSMWLDRQRQAVEAAESDEDWKAAVAIYEQVLAAEPRAAFARQGLAFAQDRQRLHAQLDHYLDDPDRIWSVQPRANAEKLLDSVASPPPDELRLAEKVRRLQDLITAANTPRTVTLQSDNMTSVQIYHVGRLGQFDTRQLELLPGDYTVVGTRQGYRDVRLTLTVRPGPAQPALDIRCEEKI